jgi:predicted outer membrane protein
MDLVRLSQVAEVRESHAVFGIGPQRPRRAEHHQHFPATAPTRQERGKVKANLPTASEKSHRTKLDKLKTLQGVGFDKEDGDLQWPRTRGRLAVRTLQFA